MEEDILRRLTLPEAKCYIIHQSRQSIAHCSVVTRCDLPPLEVMTVSIAMIQLTREQGKKKRSKKYTGLAKND